ncbi:hypothetical protein E4L95_07155 [Paracoccus liaowanqingii]|uniref:Uncharacterized protein n=1 Tax=Paracoccus liaowanqingii TaxID=2560053 RepID=A0A4Z1C166_9RHOB|nr:hypothetical protein [Paracoccus liaowanqingii]TGN62301.1 hypothetical protein E4L95_07155 [Paracoccus liaowanqingii]
MRGGDVMQWVGRLVAVVFGLGVLALLGAVAVLVGQAEGVPPMPVFLGLVGLVVLILLAGACLALISIAVSARRGAEALRLLAGGEAAAPETVAPEAEAEAEMQGPFGPAGLPQAMAAPPRATPRPNRVLVAER